MTSGVKLQVLICTYGSDGISRVAECQHPHIEGIEYLVAWQTPDGELPLPPELMRDDIRIVRSHTRGLSINRNIALQAATAPLLLISDDDVTYLEGTLLRLISEFECRPNTDFITFMYDGGPWQRSYPDHEFTFDRIPKGYFVTSFELAFRRERVAGLRFNRWFGIGAPYFPCGEEDVFVADMLSRGLKGTFLPLTLATHRHATTTQRIGTDRAALAATGAVALHVNPLTWPARLMVRALRGDANGVSALRYLSATFYGAYYALRHRVFTLQGG